MAELQNSLTLDETIQCIRDEISLNVLEGKPVLRNSTMDKFAAMMGTMQHFSEISIRETCSRLTPITSTGQLLDDWAVSFGLQRQQSTAASGFVSIVGTAGTVIPAGTTLTRCDGVTYETVEEVIISANGGAAAFVVASDAGVAGNWAFGGQLTLGSATAGVDDCVISQGISGGADLEDDDSLRQRIRLSRTQCRTGTFADYEYWARLYNGVTRVCVESPSAGMVKIYVMMDDTYANGLPTQSDVNVINDIIFNGADAVAPLGVVGEVCAPEVVCVDLGVLGVGNLTGTAYDDLYDALSAFINDSWGCGQQICEGSILGYLNTLYPNNCPSLTTTIPPLAPGQLPQLCNLSTS